MISFLLQLHFQQHHLQHHLVEGAVDVGKAHVGRLELLCKRPPAFFQARKRAGNLLPRVCRRLRHRGAAQGRVRQGRLCLRMHVDRPDTGVLRQRQHHPVLPHPTHTSSAARQVRWQRQCRRQRLGLRGGEREDFGSARGGGAPVRGFVVMLLWCE